jgi:hypothetical protein
MTTRITVHFFLITRALRRAQEGVGSGQVNFR